MTQSLIKRLSIIIIMILAMIPSYSYARITTPILKGYCTSYYDSTTSSNESMMFIMGIIYQEEVATMIHPSLKMDKYNFCVPDEVPYGKINDIVCGDLFKFPNLSDHPVILVVGMILNNHFPCY